MISYSYETDPQHSLDMYYNIHTFSAVEIDSACTHVQQPKIYIRLAQKVFNTDLESNATRYQVSVRSDLSSAVCMVGLELRSMPALMIRYNQQAGSGRYTN